MPCGLFGCHGNDLVANLEACFVPSLGAGGVGGVDLYDILRGCMELPVFVPVDHAGDLFVFQTQIGNHVIRPCFRIVCVSRDPALLQARRVYYGFYAIHITFLSAVAYGSACPISSTVGVLFTALCLHLGIVGNRDVAAVGIAAAADARSGSSGDSLHIGIVGDGDIAAISPSAAANAGAKALAGSRHMGILFDRDIFAVTRVASSSVSAANTGAILSAGGGYHGVAGNGDVAGVGPTMSAADAGSEPTAGGGQTAGVFLRDLVGVGDDQCAGIVLIHAGIIITALHGILSVQLDGHVAGARCLDGGYVEGSTVVDVHIVQGDLGGGILRRVDGDGVGGRGFTVPLGDDGGIVIFAGTTLGYRLAGFRGIDGDAAVLQIPGIRQNGHRQAANKQQGHQAGYNSSQFHRDTVSFPGLRRTGIPQTRRGTVQSSILP